MGGKAEEIENVEEAPGNSPGLSLYPVPALLPGIKRMMRKGVEGAACVRAAHGLGRATPQAKSRSALGGPGGQLIKCLSGFLFIGSADEDLAAINFYDHEWIRICLAKVKY